MKNLLKKKLVKVLSQRIIITIIVMIILAGTIILSLSSTDIMDRAEDAVNKTNLKTVQQLASTLWADAYLDGKTEQPDLKEAVINGLTAQGINTSDYKITVTTKSVKVTTLPWTQKGLTVTNGTQTLNIGDIVHYDETNGGVVTGLTATEWKLLGVNDEGELLLMSTANVQDAYILGGSEAEGMKDYVSGASELDAICQTYGSGKGAISVRSITVEDVDKITGYDKTTYNVGTISQYGNQVTYYWDGTAFPVSKSNVEDGKSGSTYTKPFKWYDEGTKAWYSSPVSTTAETTDLEVITASSNSQIIASLKVSKYYYDAATLTTIDAEKNKSAYSMLFGENDVKYWLASPCVGANTGGGQWCMRYVSGSEVSGLVLTSSLGAWGSFSETSSYPGVRAVVTLSPDVTFTGNSTSGWSI